jgi:hypothetical protein
MHALLKLTQPSNDTFGCFRFKFTGTEAFNCFFCFQGGIAPPCFNPTLPQKIFEHFLLISRKRFGRCQNSF